MKRSSESVQDCILSWLQKLSKHFGVELTEDQVEIFAHALKDSTVHQVDEAFERCLNECEFMPRLAQVHSRMPEQKYPSENPGRFVKVGPDLPDLVRPIAEEICMEFCGREYKELKTFEDAKLIHDVSAAANRIRCERMGIDTRKWGDALKLNMPKPKSWERQKAELRSKGLA